MNTFGSSAPLKDVQTKFGFTPDEVAETAKGGYSDDEAHAELHDLGQSLWLDNITRDDARRRDAAGLHRRPVGHRSDLQPDDLRQGDHGRRRLRRADPELREKGAGREDLFFELAIADLTRAARPVRPDHTRDGRRRRLGLARSLAAARLRRRGHHPAGGRPARPGRARTSSSRSPAPRRACRRSRSRSSPASRSTSPCCSRATSTWPPPTPT